MPRERVSALMGLCQWVEPAIMRNAKPEQGFSAGGPECTAAAGGRSVKPQILDRRGGRSRRADPRRWWTGSRSRPRPPGAAWRGHDGPCRCRRATQQTAFWMRDTRAGEGRCPFFHFGAGPATLRSCAPAPDAGAARAAGKCGNGRRAMPMAGPAFRFPDAAAKRYSRATI